MTPSGQEDQLPPPSLNERSRLGEATFAEMGGKEEHAPIPNIRGVSEHPRSCDGTIMTQSNGWSGAESTTPLLKATRWILLPGRTQR